MKRYTIQRGDTVPIGLIFQEDGVAVDITDYTPRICAKAKLADTAYLFNKACTKNADPTTGLASVQLSASDTDTVVRNAIGEVLLVDGAGNELTYCRFLLDIDQDVYNT